MKIWIEFLKDNGLAKNICDDPADASLHSHFIDALPSNLILENGSLVLIDTEWRYYKPFNIKTLFLRYLLNETEWLSEARVFNNFIKRHIPKGSSNPAIDFAKKFGIVLDDDAIQASMEIFNEISTIVYGSKVQVGFSDFKINKIVGSQRNSLRLLFTKLRSKLSKIVLRFNL
jgi:hypothetical protein